MLRGPERLATPGLKPAGVTTVLNFASPVPVVTGLLSLGDAALAGAGLGACYAPVKLGEPAESPARCGWRCEGESGQQRERE